MAGARAEKDKDSRPVAGRKQRGGLDRESREALRHGEGEALRPAGRRWLSSCRTVWQLGTERGSSASPLHATCAHSRLSMVEHGLMASVWMAVLHDCRLCSIGIDWNQSTMMSEDTSFSRHMASSASLWDCSDRGEYHSEVAAR